MTIGAADQGKPTRRIPKRDTAVCHGVRRSSQKMKFCLVKSKEHEVPRQGEER